MQADFGTATQSLLTFPCHFPIKVVGRREAEFAPGVLAVVRAHDPDFEPATVEVRSSWAGTYVSLTCVVHATSREQLDALYHDLCRHSGVRMVL